MSLEESRKAEARIKRRFARFKNHEHLVTRDPLVAELMLAQIDATLAVSHAIQEFGEQFGEVGLRAMHHQPLPLGSMSREQLISISTLRTEMRGLQVQIDSMAKSIEALRDVFRQSRDRMDNLERHISEVAGIAIEKVKPEPVTPHPWWAFWRGW